MAEKEMYELCFVGYEFPLYCVDVPFLLFCNHGTLPSCISVFHDGNKLAQGWWGALYLDFLLYSEGIAYESEFAGCKVDVAVVAVGFYIHNVVEWDIINFIEVFDNQLLWCVH